MIEHGYATEEHNVVTPDGYILKVFRIRGSPSSPPAEGKPVVFIQHGLLCSSADWLVMGKDRAIPYLLADEGYDIWLGNARGNKFSRKHQYLSPSGREFWDFSWHQIGSWVVNYLRISYRVVFSLLSYISTLLILIRPN